MPNVKEVIIATMMPAIKAIGKAEMKAVLSSIKEHNSEEIYRTTRQMQYLAFPFLLTG